MVDLKEKYSFDKLYRNHVPRPLISERAYKSKKTAKSYLVDSLYSTLELSNIDIERNKLTKIIKNNNISSELYKPFSPIDSLIIRNTINAYKKISDWSPYSNKDMQEAYAFLTADMDDIHDFPVKIMDIYAYLKNAECDNDLHKVIYSVIGFCEFLKYDLSEHGRLSRLWLNVSLSKINKKFVLSSFEKIFYEYKKDFETAIAHIKSEKNFEAANIIIALIKEGVAVAEKIPGESGFKAFDKEIDKDLYDEEYIQQRVESVKSKLSHKKFNNVFNDLSANTKLNEDELRELFNSLSHLWEPYLYLNHEAIEDFVSILEKYHTDSKIDMLEFLYILHECNENLNEYFEKKKNYKLGKELNDKNPTWEKYKRCCIEVHNRNIETGYKGNGQNSPRSKMQYKCEFLKKNQISLGCLGRYCRAFEKTLSKSEKLNKLPTEDIPCPYNPPKGTTSYCETTAE